MTVKDAKEKLQNLVDSLNVYNDDADFDINIYDNRGGYYTSDFGNWDIDINKERVHLNIE